MPERLDANPPTRTAGRAPFGLAAHSTVAKLSWRVLRVYGMAGYFGGSMNEASACSCLWARVRSIACEKINAPFKTGGLSRARVAAPTLLRRHTVPCLPPQTSPPCPVFVCISKIKLQRWLRRAAAHLSRRSRSAAPNQSHIGLPLQAKPRWQRGGGVQLGGANTTDCTR